MTSPASHRRTKSDGRLPVLGIGAGLLLLLLAACPGTLPEDISKYPGGTGMGGKGGGGTGGSGPPPPNCDAPAMIFAKDVTASGYMGSLCHTTTFPPLFMTETKASLATKLATTSTGACMGMPFVNTANPAASVILKRIQGAECGEQMPSKTFGATAWLSQADIDCIAGWVMAP